jgi:hypothetical protein
MSGRVLLTLGVSGLLVLAGEASAQGGTSASPVLQRDVTQLVMVADMAMDRECTQRKVVNAEIVEASPDGKSGVERWTVERCGKLVSYRITFSPSPRGGTDFSVQFEK